MQHPLISDYIKHNQYGQLIGMDFEIIKSGLLHYRLNIQAKHLATPLAAHGGLIASLCDAALGVVALSAVCEQNKVVSTVEYKINFISPAQLNNTLLAVSKVESKGNRIIVSSCDVFCENDNMRLVAKALGTFNAYPAEKAGYSK